MGLFMIIEVINNPKGKSRITPWLEMIHLPCNPPKKDTMLLYVVSIFLASSVRFAV